MVTALVAAGEHVLNTSNDKVPHETGDLERTGVSSYDLASGTAAVSYKDADYHGQAVDQHENMSYKHDEGRSAKFLELALISERQVVARIMKNAIESELGG